MTSKRLITQIGVSVDAEGNTTVLALADDGSLWEGFWKDTRRTFDDDPKLEFKWRQLPPLP